MKFFYLLFFICLLSVDAQRRSVKSELLSENEPPPKSARRGRARFTVTSETSQIDEPTKRPELASRRLISRRKPESHTEAPLVRKTYEVEEVVDETPLETQRKPKSKSYTESRFAETPLESIRRPSSAKLYTEAKFVETSNENLRRPLKTRVLTETKFEAQNAPPANSLFQPSTTESLDEIIKSIGDGLDTTFSPVLLSSTVSTSVEPSQSELSSSEFSKVENDISRTQPETTTPITSRTTRRSNGRSRSSNTVASPTVASRVRSRTRATRKPEEPSAGPTAGRTVHRGSRRRTDPAPVESRTRAPHVIQTAETVEVPTRSRNGRRIPVGRREEVTIPEKVTLDLPQSRRLGSRKSVETTTIRSRTRSRSRDIPPVIDEQKLEVLPLFERESKTVRPSRNVVSRRRNINSAEAVETSATENDIKVAPKPPKESVVIETRTESTIKRRKPVSKATSRSRKSPTSKATVQTTKPTTQTPKPTTQSPKPVIKQSVIAEVSEVTSKRTLTRHTKIPSRSKTETPKFVQRGTKKSEVNLVNVGKKSSITSSEEEIDDSDNYPEQFKALLQAKKQKKESRSPHRLVSVAPAVTKTTEKVVNSSPSTTTQVIDSEASRQLEESENELVPKKVQPSGRRFTQTTEKATRLPRKKVVVRSTTVAPLSTKEHKFHAKFNTEPEVTSSNPVKSARSFTPKPPRGLYSSRKTKESYTKNKSPTSGQIPTQKKSNRYSSRYRNDASSRGAIRTSTNAPAYLPTIPTITPPTTSVKSSYRDKDLGVEVISFDDPVNTVPSANLVSGEYLASSTESHLTSPLVSASQTKTTEKPVSIIERIINSITAISTTEVPDPTKLTTPSTENPSKESAILKLATKKPTKLDKTQTTQIIPVVTVTSEKPTTIIERILSSLSAIQADNNTDTKNFKSKQVGSNFNTISSPSTTPLTRVTKSTLSAQLSTTVNPLTVLDEISNEQTLQKRTIGKLLELLNSLTSTPSSHPIVVVTPKAANYVVGTSVVPTFATASTTTIEPILSSTSTTTTTTEPTTTTTTTTPPPTTTPTTSNQLFTSPSPSGATISSRVKPPETTTMRYTTTPIYTTISTQMPPTTTTLSSVTTTPTLSSTTEAVPSTTISKDILNEIGVNPLSLESGGTTTESSLSVSSTLPSTELDTETGFVFPSTLPALVNFEVSPGSVSIFSANDLSNAITPEDVPSTVTIPGRTNFPETVITTQTSTEVTSPIQSTTPFPNVNLNNRIASTVPSTTTGGSTVNPTTPMSATEAPSTTQNPTTTDGSTTLVLSTTTMAATNTSSQDISSNVIDTTGSPVKSNQTSTVNPPTNITSSRSGRLLNVVQDPVQNSIDNTTSVDKDYYIFAVLNNNTVLRKRPSRFPNKETPFLIVGVYPNNTIVRKFPNGTLVPMEPVIRVSGFDTRENPPPLPEITSNQVTPDQGSQPENKNLQTVEQNTIPPVEANPLSISTVNNPTTTGTTPSSTVSTAQANPLSISSSSTSTTESSTSTSTSSSSPPVSTTSGTTTSSTTPPATLPTLTEILTGRTGKAFNSIINISDLSKVETLNVDPKTNRVLNADELKSKTDVIFRWKPVTSTTYIFKNIQSDKMTTTVPSPTLSNRILDTFSTTPFPTMMPQNVRLTMTPTTTSLPTTTPVVTTTTNPPTTTPKPTRRMVTIPPLTQPVTSSFQTTTGFPTSTYFPQFLTTLFSTLRPRRISTESPFTIVTPISNRVRSTTQPTRFEISTNELDLSTVRNSRRPTTPRFEISTNGFDLSTAGSTRQPNFDLTTAGSTRRMVTTTEPPTTTLPFSTTVRSRRRGTTTVPTTTTTTQPRTTTVLTTTTTTTTTQTPPTTRATSQRNARRSTTVATATTTNGTKKLRQLTDQQRKDLEAIAQLEREQAAILRQLAFLTNLNIANTNTRTTTDRTDLAKRIVALAVERDKDRQTTTTAPPEIITPETKRETKKESIADQSLEDILKQFNIATPSTITTTSQPKRQAKKVSVSSDQSLDEIVKQFNIVTPSSVTTEYGKSNDAIIASLLKEQGIGPTTPKVLEDVYSHTTTTKRPKTTTRPPGPLMQSLNWLLNVLAPPPTTTKRPKPKPKPKSKPKPKPKPEPQPDPKPEEMLSHQPTHITPVVTPAPRRNLVSSLSQRDIQKLIRQLETIQNDPNNSQELDFSQIKSLQALLNSDEGVQVQSSGSTGATSRPTTTPLTTSRRKSKGRVAKSTTAIPLSVSNSIADDEEFVSTTTTRSRISLPPVRLRPVPGIEDSDTLVRGQLITAAVNVTRAISSFLGTALQDAAHQFTTLFASGSANLRNYLSPSSVLANVSNFSATSS